MSPIYTGDKFGFGASTSAGGGGGTFLFELDGSESETALTKSYVESASVTCLLVAAGGNGANWNSWNSQDVPARNETSTGATDWILGAINAGNNWGHSIFGRGAFGGPSPDWVNPVNKGGSPWYLEGEVDLVGGRWIGVVVGQRGGEAGESYNSSTGGGGYYNIRSNDGTNRDFYMDNNTNLRVNYGPSNIGTSNGTVVGSQSSDIRNKNLVGDGTVSYGLSEVLQLNPIKYQYKKELVDRIGFSAQQVEPIIPESVYDTGQDQDYEGNTVSGDTIKAMYYVDLIPVLVNAIKELKAENDALKKRLDDGGL